MSGLRRKARVDIEKSQRLLVAEILSITYYTM